MKDVKFKIFTIGFIIFAMVFLGVLTREIYEEGKEVGKLKEGEVFVQDGTEIYVAPEGHLEMESDGEIKIAEEGEEGSNITEEGVLLGEGFNLYTSVVFQDTEFGVHSILFYGDEDEVIGGLTWDTGVFVFEGRAKESAHQFFDHFIKAMVDNYIEEQLGKEEYIGIEFVSEDYEKNKTFLMRVTVDGKEVGIVYFDKKDNIQFRGDRKKFEKYMLKLLKPRYGKNSLLDLEWWQKEEK